MKSLGFGRRFRSGGAPTVASSAAVALVGQVSVYIVVFLVSIVTTRALGVEGRGVYFLLVTAATVVVAASDLGVDSATAATWANDRFSRDALTSNASFLAALVGPVGGAVLVSAYAALGDPLFKGVRVQEVVLMAVSVPLTLHLRWLLNIFVLSKRLASSQFVLAFGAVCQLALTVMLAFTGSLSVATALVAYVLSLSASWALLVWWSIDFLTIQPAYERLVLRRVLSLGVRMHPGLLLTFLLLRFDVFLIGVLVDGKAVGLYSVAIIFAELAWLLTGPLVQATLPFQAEVELSQAATLAMKAARLTFVMSLMVAMLMAATLWFVLPTLYGPVFIEAYPAVLLLLPGVVAMATLRPVTFVITRLERPGRYGALMGGVFALNLGLGLALIPALGISGASIASSVAYMLLCAVFMTWAVQASGLRFRQQVMVHRSDLAVLADAARRLGGLLRPR